MRTAKKEVFILHALKRRLLSLSGLADGVKVAQGPLEPLVMVRIHVGQPSLPFPRQHATTVAFSFISGPGIACVRGAWSVAAIVSRGLAFCRGRRTIL